MWAPIVEGAFSLFQHVIATTPLAVGLILLILVLRTIPFFQLHVRVIYVIWLIVMVRLWMPWTPPGPLQIWKFLSSGESSSLADAAVMEWARVEPYSFTYAAEQWVEPSQTWNSWDMIFGIWIIIAVILFFIYMGLSIYTAFTIKRIDSKPVEKLQAALINCKHELNMRRNVQVAQSREVSYPVLIGGIHPKILIPTRLMGHLQLDEWRSILLHELIHVRRGDIIWNHIMVLLVIINWFNPLVWIAYRKMREDQELSCDQVALEYTDGQEYGATLLRVASLKRMERDVAQGLLSFKGASSKTLTRRRIEMIRQAVKNKRVWTPLLVGMIAIVAVMTFTGKSTIVFTKELKGELSSQEQGLKASNNWDEISDAVINFKIPAEGKVTNKFSAKRPYVSIANQEGTPIYAAAEGVVEQAEYVNKEGNYVRITHSGGYVTTYSHLESLQVKVGEKVKVDSSIGTMGSTGHSTGSHVKWILLKEGTAIDPLSE